MYVSMSRLEIPAERACELVGAFGRRAHLADEADGFSDPWPGRRVVEGHISRRSGI